MNIDKFDIGTAPFEKTLYLRLPSTAMLDEHAANVLKEWNSPLIYAESDRYNFYYDITGRVPLRTLLGKTLTKVDAIRIFASVADAVLYAEEKGVNPKYMILDSDLVFVSEESGSMRFICVPAVNHGLAAKPLRAYIKELIVNMMYAEDENLEYIGKIINYLNKGKRLDANDFLDFLDALEMEDHPMAVPMENIEEPANQPMFVPEPQVVPVAQEMFIPQPEVMPVIQPEMVSAAQEMFVPEPEIVPNEQTMFVPEPVAEPMIEMPVSEPIMEPAFEPVAEPVMEPVAQPIYVEEAEPIPMMPSYPYFIRKRNGEKVVIDKEEFKIGKIPGMADYVVTDNPAISRMHAIIKQINGAYYVCDNYSTNSTFLNGELLEPGKNYILINGARVNFANDEFTYYLD